MVHKSLHYVYLANLQNKSSVEIIDTYKDGCVINSVQIFKDGK